MTDLQQKLIAALRSGEYRQIRSRLESVDGDCCLGVMCRVYDKEFPGRLKIVQTGSLTAFNNNRGIPPDEVSAAFDKDRDFCDDMILWNDADSLSFNQIADKLEERWK